MPGVRPGAYLFCDTVIPKHIVDDVNRSLRESLKNNDPLTDKILNHILEKQGKCVRPGFMALVAELVDGTWETVRNAAVAVEAIHLASLLHDDVVDGSELRRGAVTLNMRHSDKMAVLFGDHIVLCAFMMAMEFGKTEVVSLIVRTVRDMIGGEIQGLFDGNLPDEKKYLATVEKKTSSLFSGAGEIAILLAGGGDREREWVDELGGYVGLAFQIVDDALDYTGDRVSMGKPTLRDFIAGNMTLPLIYSLREMTGEEKKRFLDDDRLSPEELRSFVQAQGGIDYAFKSARKYTDRAKSVVARFENDAAAKKFDDFFDMLLGRCA